MVRGMIENFTRDWVIRRRLSADFSSAPIHVYAVCGSSLPLPADEFGRSIVA